MLKNLTSSVILFSSSLQKFITTEGGDISVSSKRTVVSTHSLVWRASEGNSLTFHCPISFPHDVDVAPGMQGASQFSFWVYSEKAEPVLLEVEFGIGEERACGFKFSLNFKGWRTAWVRYEDLPGAVDQMNFIRFLLPAGASQRSLWFDAIVPSIVGDRREPRNDWQISVRKDDPVQTFEKTSKRNSQSSAELLQAGEHLTSELEKDLLKRISLRKPVKLSDIISRFSIYNISREGGVLNGLHPFGDMHSLVFGLENQPLVNGWVKDHGIQVAVGVLVDCARMWHFGTLTERECAMTMFLDLQELLLDQGWTAGHNLGTIHHYGYSCREWHNAVFLMRRPLEEANLLKPSVDALRWYLELDNLHKRPILADLDFLNTESRESLATILCMSDDDERCRFLSRFASALDSGLSKTDNTHDDGFKEDGSGFHHWGHYPGYLYPAFPSIGLLAKWFAPTSIAFSPYTYQIMKNVFLTASWVGASGDTPDALGGRHPFRQTMPAATPYIDLALASPFGVDLELASIWRRMVGSLPKENFEIEELSNITPAPFPQGFIILPYAGAAVYRTGALCLAFKGYSSYVWSSEIYSPVNRYGRYQSHGRIEILRESNDMVSTDGEWGVVNINGGRAKGGACEPGWDWGRVPGTTSLDLPMKNLAPIFTRWIMDQGISPFTGGTSVDSHGVFSTVIDESRFGHQFHCQKSYHIIPQAEGVVVVSLISDIFDDNQDYPVVTTLFQHTVSNSSSASSGKNEIVIEKYGESILDPVGNTYIVLSGGKVITREKIQESFDSHSDIVTKGSFRTAWIDHGKEPRDGKAAWVLFPVQELNSFNEFSSTQEVSKSNQINNLPFTIIYHNSNVHAVREIASGIITASVFSPVSLELGPLREVNVPACIALKPSNDCIEISVSDPDLRMQPSIRPAKLPYEYHLLNPATTEDREIKIILEGNWLLSGIPYETSGLAKWVNNSIRISLTENTTTISWLSRRGRTIIMKFNCEAITIKART